MNEPASREILWNIAPDIAMPILYGLSALSMAIAAIGLLSHVQLWRAGKATGEPAVPWHQRIWNGLIWALFQKRVARKVPAGVAHTLVYLGFLALLYATTMVALQFDFGLPVFQGTHYLAITILSDVLGFGLIAGCLVFAHRRYLSCTDPVHNRAADSFLLTSLIVLCVQGFLIEGLRIHATNDPWAAYSPVGWLVAKFFWALPLYPTQVLHALLWWIHAVCVFVLIALLPYTKLFHIVASSLNLSLRNPNRPKGALQSPGDIAQLMESSDDFSIGLGTIADYSWKQLLDLDACTSCGRCQEACPAYRSGKPLSPKWVILDTRNHALTLQQHGRFGNTPIPGIPIPAFATTLHQSMQAHVFFPAHGIGSATGEYDSGGSFRAKSELVQKSWRPFGQRVEQRIASEVIDPEAFWSCTTCYACVAACPVGINHVDQIVGNRRNMALMHGEIPNEAQATLRALENQGNPYGDPKDRTKWLEGLPVKTLSPGDSVDYLYWVGCVSAYDPRKQKIARSLVQIMNAAKLSFGILGSAEGCSGDPARRLGEENLFQTMAKNNIALLRSIKFKVLVANCPHCFNTIKNEYPQFGNLGEGQSPEIIHHSQLIKRLLDRGQISLHDPSGIMKDVTFHDPCYLGRYNDEYEAPRETLKAIKSLPILEMEESKSTAMCCGAGGGHFWMDRKIGERVNVLRTEQAAATGAQRIATACPFCMQMLEDGVKLTNREGKMDVQDIAELIAPLTK